MSGHNIVWIAGTGWDSVPGTDKRLVDALPRNHHVLWIDPPIPARDFGNLKQLATGGQGSAEPVSPNVVRVLVHVLPGVTRPFIRWTTAQLLHRVVRRSVSRCGGQTTAVVVAFPLARFPRRVPGRKILYVTDDWVGGAPLMGFSRTAVRQALVANLAQADVVASVSEHLSAKLQRLHRSANGMSRHPVFTVLPNGCPEPVGLVPESEGPSEAGLVGQLNERLDLDFLEAVQATGVTIRVIGPRTDRDPAFRERLDGFLAKKNVKWMGKMSPVDLSAQLVRLGVGMTPYADTDFNRASFPLKTLEYLASGVAVVSTEMPSARWLNTHHVAISSTPGAFAENVVAALNRRNDRTQNSLRRAFAAEHTWRNRAQEFLALLEPTVFTHTLDRQEL